MRLLTNGVITECLTDWSTLELYYLHWAIACSWPIIMTIAVLSVDKSFVSFHNYSTHSLHIPHTLSFSSELGVAFKHNKLIEIHSVTFPVFSTKTNIFLILSIKHGSC